MHFLQHSVCVLGRADQQVGHADVHLIVYKRASIDSGTVEAVGQRDGSGGTAVPLILTPGMEVDVRLAAHAGHPPKPDLFARHSIVEAGARLRLTPETGRNYSKRIYAKIGAKGQADLVRRVLTGLSPFA